MKRILMILFVILIVLPAALIGGCYGAIRFQYRETFMPGLFVNGVYAADMTPQQLNDILKDNALLPTCIITDAEGEEHSFSMEEAGFREDYLAELQERFDTEAEVLTAYNYGVAGAYEHVWNKGLTETEYSREVQQAKERIERRMRGEW